MAPEIREEKGEEGMLDINMKQSVREGGRPTLLQ
jgi:hypothetical protein